MVSTVVRLERFEEIIDDADPDANFKREVVEYTKINPMPTLEGMSRSLGLPVGAIARYVLVKWATSGSEGVLELGPRVLSQMAAIVSEAEESGEEKVKLDAYRKLSGIISWLDTICRGEWEGIDPTTGDR